jgi:hypothetical protein
MHFANKTLLSFTLSVLASAASAATVTGTVTGPDGKPFMGAFVVAENPQTKMTVSVLSNQEGRYHIGNLPAATYKLRITAIGYRGEPRSDGAACRRPEGASFDFALEKSRCAGAISAPIRAGKLLPKTKDHDLSHKDALFTTCFHCHSFQKRMATETWDENGWRARVTYMRDVMMEGRRFNDKVTEDLVSLLHVCVRTQLAEARIARRPSEYKSLVRPFSRAR